MHFKSSPNSVHKAKKDFNIAWFDIILYLQLPLSIIISTMGNKRVAAGFMVWEHLNICRLRTNTMDKDASESDSRELYSDKK